LQNAINKGKLLEQTADPSGVSKPRGISNEEMSKDVQKPGFRNEARWGTMTTGRIANTCH
jgi:hypothetical protein